MNARRSVQLRKVLVTALVALPLLLVLSYPWRDAHHGAGYVASGIGWIGFLLAGLVVVVTAVMLAVGRLRSRGSGLGTPR